MEAHKVLQPKVIALQPSGKVLVKMIFLSFLVLALFPCLDGIIRVMLRMLASMGRLVCREMYPLCKQISQCHSVLAIAIAFAALPGPKENLKAFIGSVSGSL